MYKVALVIGTRPEAIKMIPVINELGHYPNLIEPQVCLTGQHREMLTQVLDLFGINAQHNLDIMTYDQDLTDITALILSGIRDYLRRNRPDVLLVHGDTTTTMAASLAAFYEQVRIGHVEAGLRTHNMHSPFPEEMNRRVTDTLSNYYFAPTAMSRSNLEREGISAKKILVTGNTAIDALFCALSLDTVAQRPSLFTPGKRGILVTAHRRENQGDGIRSICEAIRLLAKAHDDIEFIYPVHYNPNIRGPVHDRLSDLENVRLLDPVDYDVMVGLLQHAELILTDSGGIQEEAPSLGKPVLVMRDCTERPEAVAAGTVILVGTDRKRIVTEAERLLTDARAYTDMARAINPYGDGKAAARIVRFLLAELGHVVPAVGYTEEFVFQSS